MSFRDGEYENSICVCWWNVDWLIVKKMEKWASENGKDLVVKATGVGGYESKWQDYDCILVGPQVRFKIPEMKEKVKIPVAQIETLDYGLQNVDNMLKLAYSLVESSND